MKPADLIARKAECRNRLKQIRGSLPAAYRTTASTIILEKLLGLEAVASARTVFTYISHGNEVDTHGLLRHFLDTGVTVAVPKIVPGKTMIACGFRRWEDLAPGELGILTPAGDTPCPGPFDVVITPGLGFTPRGDRIGYGRGYYDRWFAEHRTAKKIALAYDAQVSAELPVAPSDIPVDVLVTEKRIIVIS